MGLDHSQAFVRISFDGLIGFCICTRDDYRCEMGMVPEPAHDPLIKIVRLSTDGTRKVILDNYRLGPTDDVKIEAVKPVGRGVSTFTGSVWDPVGDQGDAEDFRWVMNLQGERFHGEYLKLNQGTGATLLRPKVTIPHGIFYTKEKTSVAFRRFRRPNFEPRVPIGKIADILGADILCDFDAGQKTVRVTIGSQAPSLLEFKTAEGAGFRYKIKITNLCRRSGGGPTCRSESDFPHYYKVATDEEAITYDLQPIYPPGDPRGTNPIDDDKYFPQLQGFASDGPPEVCSVAFFGRANFIP
jgi:hypothetical protein